MRFRLPLPVVLAVLLALASAQNVCAVTTWTATNVSVSPGGSGTSTVTAHGPNAEFFYVCVGLPSGTTCQYSTGGHLDTFVNDPDTEILTITTSLSTPTGIYTITLHITGSLNGPQADTTFKLYVGTTVGGIVVPTDIFTTLAPCLAVIGLVATAAVAVKWKRVSSL